MRVKRNLRRSMGFFFILDTCHCRRNLRASLCDSACPVNECQNANHSMALPCYCALHIVDRPSGFPPSKREQDACATIVKMTALGAPFHE